MAKPFDIKIDPDLLFDQPPKGLRLIRLSSVQVDEETYRIAQELIHDPRLSHSGDLSSLVRAALDLYADSLREFLSPTARANHARLRDIYREISTERQVALADEIVDKKYDTLQVLTSAKNWNGIVQSVNEIVRQVDSFQQGTWQPVQLAQGWVSNRNIAALRRIWGEQMPPQQWQQVQEMFQHLSNLVED